MQPPCCQTRHLSHWTKKSPVSFGKVSTSLLVLVTRQVGVPQTFRELFDYRYSNGRARIIQTATDTACDFFWVLFKRFLFVLKAISWFGVL